MPNSVRCIIKKCLHKGAMTQEEHDKIIRKLDLLERKGKWISLDDYRGKYNDNGYKCSECGEHSDYEENFCPNCGARMER